MPSIQREEAVSKDSLFFKLNEIRVKTQVSLGIERKGVWMEVQIPVCFLRFSLFLHLILPRFISKLRCLIGIEWLLFFRYLFRCLMSWISRLNYFRILYILINQQLTWYTSWTIKKPPSTYNLVSFLFMKFIFFRYW